MRNDLPSDKKLSGRDKKIQKALSSINSTNQVVDQTLAILDEHEVNFDSSIKETLTSVKALGDALLDSSVQVSKEDSARYFALLKQTDEIVNDSTNAAALKQLRAISDEQNVRTVANESLFLRFRDTMSVTGQSMQEFVTSNVGAISTTDLSQQLTKSLPLAMAGPLGPLVSAVGDVVNVGDIGKKTFSAGKALVSGLFGKDEGGIAKQAESIASEAEKITSAIEKQVDEETVSKSDVQTDATAKQVADAASSTEQATKETALTVKRTEALTERLVMNQKQQAAEDANSFFVQEDARDAQEQQSAELAEAIGHVVNTNEEVRDAVEDAADDGKGKGMLGMLGSVFAPLLGLGAPLLKFAGAAKGFPNMLGKAVGGIFSTIKAFPKALFSGAGKVFKGGLVAFAAAHVVNSFSNAADEMSAMSPSDIDSYGGNLGESGGMLNFGLAYFRKGINTVFGGLPDQISAWLSEQDWFAAIIDGMFTEQGRQDVIDSLSGWFMNAVDGTVELLSPVLAPLFDPLFLAFDNVKAAGMNVYEAITDAFDPMFVMIDTFTEKVDTFTTMISDTVTGTFDSVMETINSIPDRLSATLDQILDSIPFFGGDSDDGYEGLQGKALIDRLEDNDAANDKWLGKDSIDLDALAKADLSPDQLKSIIQGEEKLDLAPLDRITISNMAYEKEKSMVAARGTERLQEIQEKKSAVVQQHPMQQPSQNVVVAAGGGGKKRSMEIDDQSLMASSFVH